MSVNNSKNIVEVKNISFSFGKEPVLKNISFDIHEGDYLGIVGPNGSGKTTLLRVMLGLIKPSGGEIKFFGQALERFSDWSKVGYVPQKATNFDPLFPVTVSEVVQSGRYGKRGLARRLTKADQLIINRALLDVGMLDLKDKLIGDLSGGQQQRVFIARALAGEPKIIFLDEPTVGVDIKTQEDFYNLLRKLNRGFGITLVLVSHDIDVIANEATNLACINQTLIYHGKPEEFVKGDYLEKLYGKSLHRILHGH